MVEYIPQERDAGPVERELEIADPSLIPVPEIEEFIENLSELNSRKQIYEGANIYRLSEQIRTDPIVGQYTVLVVSEFGPDKAAKALLIITPIDKATRLPLANCLNKDIKKTNDLLRAKGLLNFAKKRNIHLKAATATKLQVQFVPEKDQSKALLDLQRRLRGGK
jgi:hypothetical protein